MSDKELLAHAILGNGGTIFAICITKQIAEDYAKAFYKPGQYRIVLATNKHFYELKDE